MFEDYGLNRVMDVKDVMPVLAWKLDNRRFIYDNEMLIRVTEIHVEAASFKQICSEAAGDTDRIKEQFFSIVNARGKLHNPFTNTGGLLAGVVERIGERYVNNKDVKVGDPVLVQISTSMIPLYLEKIHSIDMVLGHISVDGYAILFNNCSLIKRSSSVPLDLLMIAFEESSSIYHVNHLAAGKNEILVIGSNPLTTLLYGYSVRKSVGRGGSISVLFHKNPFDYPSLDNVNLDHYLRQVFDSIYSMNLSNPLECAEALLSLHPNGFDMSTNCADVAGAEAINVTVAREGGTVFFSSLINNYNIALFLTEGMGKELKLYCADGYAQDYDQFMFEMLEEINPTAAGIGHLLYEAERRRNSVTLTGSEKDSADCPEEFTTMDFIANSPEMRALTKEIIKAAKFDCSVLLRGETGVGKEKITDLIHRSGNRKMQRCVRVNCAAIPAGLMESEFFGYEKGAFTGANATGKTGYFEQAHKGILFLDEVGDLPLEMQAKLLRVLQDKEFYRLGGEMPVHADVRIIAASNRDLKKMTAEGLFREDLYYRLSVLPIVIPPLRDRRADIIPMAEHFINKYSERYGIAKRISDEGLQYFLEYDWPGNIRELENVIQRLLINSEEFVISGLTVLREMNKDQCEAPHVNAKKETPAKRALTQLLSKSAIPPGSTIPEGLTLPAESAIPPWLTLPAESALSAYPEELNLQEYMEQKECAILKSYLKKYRTTRRAAKALHMTQAQFMRKKKKYGF